MSPRDLLEQLLELASRAQLEVRILARPGTSDSPREFSLTESAACRVGDRIWVVLAPDDPSLRQAEVLAGALVRHRSTFLGETYLLPAVRSFVDRMEPG